ncbi:acyl carrier protein [Streptomyces iconiensis]|uniref:Acyl carrier protein n=1 Tax=Streptomyces iconiensis TaxID=1384038 RepID=A0ABT7A6V0_9ACTN|nr:acyl carrier protein [Streptomyces iconiensis]MDJ1136556.1 acyl carrier protein [Streptomyces iconiensis]
MTRESIVSSLADILNEVADVEPSDVAYEKTLAELDVDSLAMIEIIVSIEKVFSISLPDDELKSLRTVGDIVDKVESQLGAAA